MKICGECEFPFSYDHFHKKTRMPDGYSYYCKGCTSDRAKKYYRGNEQVRVKVKNRTAAAKREAQIFVYEYLLKHPCACGEARPACLDFDHQNDKVMNVSKMVTRGWSIDSIKAEIAKCIVRCANCHRAKTAEDFDWYSWYPQLDSNQH